MKSIQIIIAAFLFLFFTSTIRAQGWNQDRSGIYSIGIGGTQAVAFGTPYPAIYGSGLSLNISGEYKVQRFIGIGFQTGLDFFLGPPYNKYYARYSAVGIPIAFKVNVHILEAANASIKDKLDVYAGLNVGGGPAFYTSPYDGYSRTFGFLQAGPQVGIRYWLTHHVAVFGEFGWGATFANVGFSF